jgi:hypothetical protein
MLTTDINFFDLDKAKKENLTKKFTTTSSMFLQFKTQLKFALGQIYIIVLI